MARYYEIVYGSTINLDFPTRAAYSVNKRWFQDFILGGGRDKKAYGLTQITPSLTTAYDVNGINLLQYVLGSAGAPSTVSAHTLTALSTIHEIDQRVSVDGEHFELQDAKIDTWEIVVETGEPVKAEFTSVGKSTTGTSASVFDPNFNNMPLVRSDCSLYVNGVENTDFIRFALNINNNIEPIFKTSTTPDTIRLQGLDITGRIRAYKYSEFVAQGSWDICFGSLGSITLHTVNVLEVPPSVSGYDLPEVELAFTAFPTEETVALTAYLVANKPW